MTPVPHFSTPERVARLDAVARSWLGTRYVQSGAVKGCGASCHCLAGAVLAEAGVALPPVPGRGITRLREYRRAMQAWLDGHPETFLRIPGGGALAPGDVLLCEVGIGHIGLYVGDPGARVLQVLHNIPAHFASMSDPSVSRWVIAAYRPISP